MLCSGIILERRVTVLEFEGHGVRILEYAHVGGGNRGSEIPSLLPHRQLIRMLNRPVSRGGSGDQATFLFERPHSSTYRPSPLL